MRGELGADAAQVQFLDMETAGYNPARIIPVWRDFLDRTVAAGTPVRGIGEPVWPGRDEAALDECHRHESLLNLAFADDREWTLLCPYDSNALDDDVLESAGEAALARLRGDRRLDVVVAVNELATNSVLHGGGYARCGSGVKEARWSPRSKTGDGSRSR